MTCAACKKDFEDKDRGLFLTCPTCRIPDDRPEQHTGCSRFEFRGSSGRSRSGEKRELTHETKFGSWHG